MTPSGKGDGVLKRLLAPGRVVVAEGARDKWEAIRHLVDVLVDTSQLGDIERQRILNAVFERERKMSTGLERGLAIPHGVYDGVAEELGVLGIFRDGVDFQAHDGRRSDFVMMLVYPPDARKEHVQNLSAIVRTLSSESLCAQLRVTAEPELAFAHLSAADVGDGV
ncbi:PTS sugar transporter subunit IIA [Candidatus Poribacteria bacterium]|nr:PTS sugar transporter subunit IIA [Candidatus Poribacteria bacterium]